MICYVGIQLLQCSDISLPATLFSVVWSMTYIFHKYILFIHLIGFEIQTVFQKLLKKSTCSVPFSLQEKYFQSIYSFFNYKTKEKFLFFVFI